MSALEMTELNSLTLPQDNTFYDMNSNTVESNEFVRRRDTQQHMKTVGENGTSDFEEGQCNGRGNNTRSATEMALSRDNKESVRGSDANDALSPSDTVVNGSTGVYGFENKRDLKAKLSDYSEQSVGETEAEEDPMTMRMGILWLGVITVGVSLMSDILVTTIDGFAKGSNMSEVFTSIVIIPYFSNIAEQVSAVIFAHKNKMDLCVGVTVGSAIQIALCVLPGCVLVGWCMDRPMTLYFRVYETTCLLLGILCMAAVLQGGTTNWIVGVFFIGVYFMIAAGFAFHEQETLSW